VNARRAELAQANAALVQQLSDGERRWREAAASASSLELQLGAVRDAAASKDRLIEQLKAVHEAESENGCALPGSPSSSRSQRPTTGSAANGAPHPKIEKVALAWKEAGRLKDLKVEELSFQLGQVRCEG